MYNREQIVRKLLGRTADAPNEVNTPKSSSSSEHTATLRPTKTRDVSYDAKVPIGCLDASPDGRFAVLGGRHILQTVQVDNATIRQELDIRGLISSDAKYRDTTGSATDQLSVKDVKWAPGRNDATIFTACANGNIFRYDVQRLSATRIDRDRRDPLEVVQLREDSRQINSLAVNPHGGLFLLAGNQEGLIRCFDIRDTVRGQSGDLTFRAVQAFKSNADAVRNIQWSPKFGYHFACGTDQGVVMQWDFRKPTTPLHRINAHEKACTSVAWHPDGDHLISGGWDNKCHVWNLSAGADKRQSPKWTIKTPAQVAAVAWRPGLWSLSAQGKRAAQVAVTYDATLLTRHGINACHLWDLSRPTMPYKDFRNFSCPPAALTFRSSSALWTAGHDGRFVQFDVSDAPRMLDRLPTSVFAFASNGDLAMMLDERPTTKQATAKSIDRDAHSPIDSSLDTPKLGISRSQSEEDISSSFLGGRQHLRAGSWRTKHGHSAQNTPLSTTPPSGAAERVLPLDQSVKATGHFKSQQAMAVGYLSSPNDPGVYHYLSEHYLTTMHNMLPRGGVEGNLLERIGKIMEHFAKAAGSIGRFRLAQTWRILSFAVAILLEKRAEYHEATSRDMSHATKQSADDWQAYELSSQVPSFRQHAIPEKRGFRSLLSEGLEAQSSIESPVMAETKSKRTSSPGNIEGAMEIDPSVVQVAPKSDSQFSKEGAKTWNHASPHEASDFVSGISQHTDTTFASTEGYDFYDTGALATMDKPMRAAESRRTFQATNATHPIPVRPPVPTQESDDSFGQILPRSPESYRASNGRVTKREERNIDDSPTMPRSVVRDASRTDTTGEPRDGAQSMARIVNDDYYMTTQTTIDSISSQKGEVHPRPDQYSQPATQQDSIMQDSLHQSSFAPSSSDITDDGSRRDADVLPLPDDPPFVQMVAKLNEQQVACVPLDPEKLVAKALDFECRSSLPTAAVMVLLLQPLVTSRVMDALRCKSIIRQYHARLMAMQLFQQAALLRKMCVKGWAGRSLATWGSGLEVVSNQVRRDDRAGLICPNCRQPRDLATIKQTQGDNWRCEHCRSVMGPCAVCQTREIAADMRNSTAGMLQTWWICQGCGHGGHSACLDQWHGVIVSATGETTQDASHLEPFSDGCCPLDGCGHACLPGKRRTEDALQRAEQLSQRVRDLSRTSRSPSSPRLGSRSDALGLKNGGGSHEQLYVTGDDEDIQPSRAVTSMRQNVMSKHNRIPGVSSLSSSPNRPSGTDRERRKSVKFVGPDV